MAKIKGWKVYGRETKDHKVWTGKGKRAPSVRLTHVYFPTSPKTKVALYWKVETWDRDKLQPREKTFKTKKEAKKHAKSFMIRRK